MAAVPALRTWTAGTMADAASLNLDLRDAANFILSLRPYGQFSKNVTQSLTTATWTNVTWQVEEFDNDNGHSTVTNTERYTAVTPGRYLVCGVLMWNVNTTGNRGTRITVNGSVINATQTLIGAPASNSASAGISETIVTLNVGDYVQIQAWQDSGGALVLQANAAGNGCRFTLLYIGT